MFEQFYFSIQQNFKLFLIAPIICAIFRAIFIAKYNPHKTLQEQSKKIWECFHFGFWWGMDLNAYIFLIPMILISIPEVFITFIAQEANTLRLILIGIYLILLYAAFMGKLIFYKHYHDIFNYIIYLGKNAEKNNLIDIFFNQDHGLAILLGFIPYLAITIPFSQFILALPSLPFPTFSSVIVQYIFNICFFLGSIALFYYFRYGGTFMHDNKPEWDNMPPIIKEDIFLAKASVDDLVALKKVLKRPLHAEFKRTDEDLEESITRIVPPEFKETWTNLKNPLYAFAKKAKGSIIGNPKHIFIVVGESIPQWSLDEMYTDLHVAEGAIQFLKDEHTAAITNALPSGNTSRPSIVSLMSGIFDAKMEINEREAFWKGTMPTSLPVQLKKLGYQSYYWYGGSASHGNFNHFGKGQGFDKIESATEFCGKEAPQTWVGVYDKVFLEKAAEIIQTIEEPTCHFLYTTSNHGPYKMSAETLDFDSSTVMPSIQDDLKNNKEAMKILATYRYSDQAIFDFIAEMKSLYPDSLFIVTGDHSNLFGNHLANTSLVPRDHTIREQYCTPIMFQHPNISQELFGDNKIATHLNIIPTLFELIAPKDFIYYSLFTSLTEKQPEVITTPLQWITNDYIGNIGEDYKETLLSAPQVSDPILTTNNYKKESSNLTALTSWMVKHEDSALE